MAKVKYNGIVFDSDLEVQYYQELVKMKDSNKIVDFHYHPPIKIFINTQNKYTPDFIVEYHDRIEIVETKGYNPYSKLRDDMIHNVMLGKEEKDLKDYVISNGIGVGSKDVIYRKVKYLKAYGFVDWDFKNPNTIANQRKHKIDELKEQVKELSKFKKDCERYFGYEAKIKDGKKLTKSQQEWFDNYTKLNIDKYIVIIK